jgi:hypothetical protein
MGCIRIPGGYTNMPENGQPLEWVLARRFELILAGPGLDWVDTCEKASSKHGDRLLARRASA